MTPRLARPVDWLAILRETFHIWIERDAFTYSAALAFFAIFSLGPVLVVFTEGAALFFDPAAVFVTGNAIVSWLLVTVLFALLYRVLPDVEIPWRDVWVGALLTALLLSVGKWAIGFYMGRSAIALEYGAAGSMIVMLFWVYFASLLVLFGAVFTRVQARHFEEHRLRATRGAVRVETVKKELPT